MKNIYNERLIKFATHLAVIRKHPEHGLFTTVTLVALEKKVRVNYFVKLHTWVLEELPAAFKEWEFHEKTGDPVLIGNKNNQSTITSVIDFFNLTIDEFNHLFDVEGFQRIDRFGGAFLTIDSIGDDIGRNMFELAKRRMTNSEFGFVMDKQNKKSEVLEISLLNGKILVEVAKN